MSKLITARKGYKKPRNGPLFVLGVDRVNNNIFDGGGISGLNTKIKGTKGATAAIGAGATLVGGLANKGISGGLQSNAGSLVSTLGGTAGSIVGLFNPIAGAAITVGSQVLGGLANRAFGMKTNTAALNAANEGTSYLNNFRSNASNFDEITGIQSVANVLNAYKGGWFSKGKARRKNAELRRQRDLALGWADRSIENNITNLLQDQMNNALYNYAAFGGMFDSIDPTSPIGYAMKVDDLINYRLKNSDKGMTNMFAGSPSILAFGGNTESNGGTWSDGMTHVDVGGSHEENPNDGVLLGVDNEGTPNLVEEGEVIYDDYVFSNRLIVPKIKKKKDLSQEEKVLKKYSGKTYASAAKKVEKDSGVAERPNDPIAKRGFEATLLILATSLEREREKEKLQELQDAIDNMSPEELAALQQLMLAVQQQSQEEAIALQQAQAQLQQLPIEEMQLMSPEEAQQMQLMQQIQLMLTLQQSVAALGGVLDTPDNMYPYGGSLALFKKELRDRGISEEEYLRALYTYLGKNEEHILRNLDSYKESPDEWWNEGNFNRDFADTFLKKYPNKVEGPEAEAVNYYNENHDTKLRAYDWINLSDKERNKYIRQYRRSLNKNEKVEFNEKLGLYNQYLPIEKDIASRGAKKVSLDEKGKPLWENLTGLSRIEGNEDANDFYGNIADLEDDLRTTRGIYDYKQGRTSSLDRKEGVQLYGWNTDLDGNYIVDKSIISPNLTSLQAGNTAETYPVDLLGDLVYGTDEYAKALESIQKNKDYISQTEFVENAIREAQKEGGKLSPQMLRYLEYLDNNSNTTKKLFENGKLVANAADLYKRRRNDGMYGIYHYQYDLGEDSLANRYFYKDPESGDTIYVNKPGEGVEVATNPTVNKVGNVAYNDYEVKGSNLERTLTRLPNGNVWDVSDIDDLSQWKALDKPLLEDPKNTALGVNPKTNWVDYNSSPLAKLKATESDPFPKASNWPYLAAGIALLGALGYNIFSKPDYSNANAMIKAGMQAGQYMPVAYNPMGNFHVYKPDDPWFYTSPIIAQGNATQRAIANTTSPSKWANTIANSYKTLLALGNATRQALEHNDEKEFKTKEANNALYNNWSEGFLKADMANQDAFARAQGYSLEGQKAGYAMRQAIDDAKAAGINAGISGLVNLLPAYAQNKYNQDMIGWGIRNGVYAPQDIGHWATKGGKISRRKKGLNF